MPFSHFLLLPTPTFAPPPADISINFQANLQIHASARQPKGDSWSWIGAIPLSGAGAPVVTVANSRTVRLATGATFPFPGGSAPLQPESILPVDFNYDFKMDLVLAGERAFVSCARRAQPLLQM